MRDFFKPLTHTSKIDVGVMDVSVCHNAFIKSLLKSFKLFLTIPATWNYAVAIFRE